jgi:hypothetical protein
MATDWFLVLNVKGFLAGGGAEQEFFLCFIKENDKIITDI